MNKIFGFLKKMTSVEVKQFQKFIGTDLFNKREDVKSLLNYWIKHSQNMKKGEAFTHIYPNKKFNSKEWNLLASRLFRLGEQFLSTKALLEEPIQQKMAMANFYRKRKMPSYYQTNFIEKKKLLKKYKLKNEFWLQQNFATEFDYYDYVASQNRKTRTNLQEVTDTLDTYYLANKLKIACASISRQNINQEIYEIILLDEILHTIENDNNLLNEPTIKVYYYCYKAFTQGTDEKWFTLLRETMETYHDYFPPTDQRDIYLSAISYCVRQLNVGNKAFIKETLELYRLGLNAGFLLEDGVMPEITFINIAILCIRLEEYEWAENFIENHKNSLKPIFRNPMYYYSLGRLLYAQNKYDESLKSLAQVDTKAKFLLLGTKVLQLKIYFEQKEMNLLENLLESFRVYLHRQKNLGFQKRNNEFFISCVRRLLDLSISSKEKKEKFRKEVSNADFFTEKDWVLAQM